MPPKCNFIWPSNSQVCCGDVVLCPEFPRPDDEPMSWSRLYGAKMLKIADDNPEKAICLRCGTLHPVQLELQFD